MDNSKKRLVDLLQKHALLFGDFTLKSGAKSNFYIDVRRLSLCDDGAHAITDAFRDTIWNNGIKEGEWDSIAGPVTGADPIIGMILSMSAMGFFFCKYGFMVRGEAEDHGTGSLVEGQREKLKASEAGQRVIVIEDVTTSGNSALDAVRKIEAEGGEILAVVTVLDRLQGAAEMFSKAVRPDGNIGYKFIPLTTVEELDFNDRTR